MANVLRFGALRLANVTEQSLLNIRKYKPTIQQVCFISGKTLRGSQKLVKAKPYDYKNKSYNVLNAILDKTTHRMDENSKVLPQVIASNGLQFTSFLSLSLSVRRSFWSKVHWRPANLSSPKNWPMSWKCCTYQRLTWTWFSSIHTATICVNWIRNCRKCAKVTTLRISVAIRTINWLANCKFVC